MRRLACFLTFAATLAASGCGTKFDLPTETPDPAPVPTDQSYAMLATWQGMDGIQDVLLTQGTGSQLFMLFNRGGTGGPETPRGDVALYTFTRPTPIGPPYFSPPTGLFNPMALAATRDRLFVLDQGDTCLARYDDRYNTCAAEDTTGGRPGHGNPIRNLNAFWRVREYTISGGDTISTFTDTTFAQVYGVTADDQGFVYVSGIAVVLDTLQTDVRIRTRKFVSRVYRYARGARYPGVFPPDVNMPGATWHRDTSWVIFDGTGNSSVSDPRGIAWTRTGPASILVADRGNNKAKLISALTIGAGTVRVDGSETGSNFDGPSDVAVDLAGFLYIVDRNNRRVLRYDGQGNYVQIVNVEPNSDGQALLDPVSVGVDDSLAYVADRGRGQVLRFKRRP